MSATSTNFDTPAIEMRGVAVGTMKDPTSTVAEEVNWTVNAGEFWVVGGAQGSGKSDFLMMTGGLMSPVAGAYRFFGEGMPIFEDARLNERLRLGFVFDGGRLFNHMTVAENVALPLRYHQHLAHTEEQSRVTAMLESLELTPWADRFPANVARNWQKRAGLARALMLQPDVLLLDNLLAGLDVRHRNWWLNFLDQLSRGQTRLNNGPTTLIVTADDLRPWRGHARQVACLIEKRLHVFGNWLAVDACRVPAVGDLLDAGFPMIDRNTGI